ncbi:DUF3347 domain-containing protein [Maribacter arcticus]|uniref:DUF3347 domain-containing protein n=1 Tax=Maribacter arcticus TaxID=561365 RepID=UPI0030D73E8B|tara:strand:- start:4902 stop:5477 length:576 start_codon:yes stop_codon:yes gene_type:complete
MKIVKRSLGTIALATTMIVTVSCKDGKKVEAAAPVEKEMNNNEVMTMNTSKNVNAEAILSDYFNLKDALVADDNEKGKELGLVLTKSLQELDVSSFSDSEQNELKDIIEDANEHAEHIGESDINHQREHFKILSKDITDMVAITGTEITLYEQFCPMYDGGTAWLSTKEEVRNPYYGSQMLTCGKVQREIN